jgi:hypothetical protein
MKPTTITGSSRHSQPSCVKQKRNQTSGKRGDGAQPDESVFMLETGASLASRVNNTSIVPAPPARTANPQCSQNVAESEYGDALRVDFIEVPDRRDR